MPIAKFGVGLFCVDFVSRVAGLSKGFRSWGPIGWIGVSLNNRACISGSWDSRNWFALADHG
jgi:hypothetical protein